MHTSSINETIQNKYKKYIEDKLYADRKIFEHTSQVDMEKDIQHFFGDAKSYKAYELIQFLKLEPVLANLALIPVNLDKICELWDKQEISNRKGFQVTEVCHELYLQLLRIYLLRYTKIESTVTNPNQTQLEVPIERLLQLLKDLAFSQVKINNFSEIPKSEIDRLVVKYSSKDANITKAEDLEKIVIKDSLLKSGFLITLNSTEPTEDKPIKSNETKTDESQNTNNTSIYFTDKIYQDYLAASYLLDSLKPSIKQDDYPRFVECFKFIRENKYNPTYKNIILFLIGLTSPRSDRCVITISPKTKKYIRDALFATDNDVVGIRHAELMLYALEQAWSDRDLLPNHTEEDVINWIFASVNPDNLSDGLALQNLRNSLGDRLQRCPNVALMIFEAFKLKWNSLSSKSQRLALDTYISKLAVWYPDAAKFKLEKESNLQAYDNDISYTRSEGQAIVTTNPIKPRFKHRTKRIDLLLQFANHPNPDIHIPAITKLIDLKNSDLINPAISSRNINKVLFKALMSNAEHWGREFINTVIYAILIEINVEPELCEALTEALATGPYDTRYKAINALGCVVADDVLPWSELICDKVNPFTRAMAAAGLKQSLHPSSNGLVYDNDTLLKLINMLNDTSPYVICEAARSLRILKLNPHSQESIPKAKTISKSSSQTTNASIENMTLWNKAEVSLNGLLNNQSLSVCCKAARTLKLLQNISHDKSRTFWHQLLFKKVSTKKPNLIQSLLQKILSETDNTYASKIKDIVHKSPSQINDIVETFVDLESIYSDTAAELVTVLKQNITVTQRAIIINILGNIKSIDDFAIEILLKELDNPHESIVYAAIKAFSNIKSSDSKIIKALLKLVDGTDNKASSLAIETLYVIHPEESGILSVLIDMLKDNNAARRYKALSAINKLNLSNMEFLPYLLKLLLDEHPGNRYLVSTTLNRMLSSNGIESTKALLDIINIQSDSDEYYQHLANIINKLDLKPEDNQVLVHILVVWNFLDNLKLKYSHVDPSQYLNNQNTHIFINDLKCIKLTGSTIFSQFVEMLTNNKESPELRSIVSCILATFEPVPDIIPRLLNVLKEKELGSYFHIVETAISKILNNCLQNNPLMTLSYLEPSLSSDDPDNILRLITNSPLLTQSVWEKVIDLNQTGSLSIKGKKALISLLGNSNLVIKKNMPKEKHKLDMLDQAPNQQNSIIGKLAKINSTNPSKLPTAILLKLQEDLQVTGADSVKVIANALNIANMLRITTEQFMRAYAVLYERNKDDLTLDEKDNIITFIAERALQLGTGIYTPLPETKNLMFEDGESVAMPDDFIREFPKILYKCAIKLGLPLDHYKVIGNAEVPDIKRNSSAEFLNDSQFTQVANHADIIPLLTHNQGLIKGGTMSVQQFLNYRFVDVLPSFSSEHQPYLINKEKWAKYRSIKISFNSNNKDFCDAVVFKKTRHSINTSSILKSNKDKLDKEKELQLAEMQKKQLDIQNKRSLVLYSAFAEILKDNVEILDLSNNNLTDEDMRALAWFLENNNNLRVLKLSHNHITNSGFEIITKALELNPSVKYLLLDYNYIDWTPDECERIIYGVPGKEPATLKLSQLAHVDVSMNFIRRGKLSTDLPPTSEIDKNKYLTDEELFQHLNDDMNLNVQFIKTSYKTDCHVHSGRDKPFLTLVGNYLPKYKGTLYENNANITVYFYKDGLFHDYGAHAFFVIERVHEPFGQRELLFWDLIKEDENLKIRFRRLTPSKFLAKTENMTQVTVRGSEVISKEHRDKLIKHLHKSQAGESFKSFVLWSTKLKDKNSGKYNCYKWICEALDAIDTKIDNQHYITHSQGKKR